MLSPSANAQPQTLLGHHEPHWGEAHAARPLHEILRSVGWWPRATLAHATWLRPSPTLALLRPLASWRDRSRISISIASARAATPHAATTIVTTLSQATAIKIGIIETPASNWIYLTAEGADATAERVAVAPARRRGPTREQPSQRPCGGVSSRLETSATLTSASLRVQETVSILCGTFRGPTCGPGRSFAYSAAPRHGAAIAGDLSYHG